MRYRALDENWDYQFGRGILNFHIDTPEAVAQAVLSRLKLWLNEWFVDPTDGTPWLTEITGAHTQGTRDIAIKSRVLGTEGVVSITNYFSSLENRHFTVSMSIVTVYGEVSLNQMFSL